MSTKNPGEVPPQPQEPQTAPVIPEQPGIVPNTPEVEPEKVTQPVQPVELPPSKQE